MIKKISVAILLQVCWVVFVKNDPFVLPDGYVKCNISDPNFNKCATDSLGKLVSMGVKGIPALGIKPLEPVYIQYASFKSSPSSPISMQLEMKNITFYGFGQLMIMSTEGTDLRNNVIQMEGLIPNSKVVANYTMSGKILTLPIQGSGSAVITFRNMKLTYRTNHYRMKKNNRTYLAVRDMTLNADVEGGSVMYKSAKKNNLFGLSDNEVNDALNDNFMAMYEEYKSVINDLILSLISPKIVKFNNEVPFEALFVE